MTTDPSADDAPVPIEAQIACVQREIIRMREHVYTLEHTGDTDDVPVYTAEQLRSYAEAARAPLLARIAELERFYAGTEFCKQCLRWKTPMQPIDAALQSQQGEAG